MLFIIEGVENLIKVFKVLGYKMAILFGGFIYFGKYFQRKLGIDYVYVNDFVVEDGKVIGEVVGQVVDGKWKVELFKQLVEKEGLDLQQVIVVGDGVNDLLMLNFVGLGIVFCVKLVVKENVEYFIFELGLDGILYLLGVWDWDSEELLKWFQLEEVVQILKSPLQFYLQRAFYFFLELSWRLN